MYYFLALLTGVLISVMVAFNGQLTAAHGIYTASAVIHVTGLVFVSLLLIAKRELPFPLASRGIPFYLYLGGAAGVITVVLTNFAFGQITVSALLAMGLFGQSLSGIAVDQFGLFGMARHPFNRRKLIGLALMLSGIGVMMTDFGGAGAMLAALAAFATGGSIAMSRALNARLAAHIGTRRGVWICHAVGLAVVLPLVFMAGRGEAGMHMDFIFTQRFFIYMGGMLGVIVIMMDNITAVRIPAFYLAMLLFVGQISAGMGVDFILDRAVSIQNMLGAVLVACGLCVNVLIERAREKPQDNREK